MTKPKTPSPTTLRGICSEAAGAPYRVAGRAGDVQGFQRMQVIASLIMALSAIAPAEAKMFSTKSELQTAVDSILDRCAARPNLRAKALNEKLVSISFDNPPTEVFADPGLKCVLTEGRALSGVTFGVIGSEQYLDDEGHRQ